MGLGNEDERRAAIKNSSGDLSGFERELLLLGKGQLLLSTTFKDVPLPVQVPQYQELLPLPLASKTAAGDKPHK